MPESTTIIDQTNLNTLNASTPSPSIIAATPKSPKPHRNLLPLVIILAILSCASIGISIFFGIQSFSKDSELSDLKAQINDLKTSNSQLQATLDRLQQSTNKDPQTPNTPTPNLPTETLYFEPEGWDVKFAYPEGVTKVIGSTNSNYDGALYIDSITYNDKTYDVNLFGGAESYRHYPFFLGVLMRWDSEATHEDWENNPSQLGGILIFEQGSIGYYYGSYGGNGYETGEKADYDKAVELTSQLLHNITAK